MKKAKKSETVRHAQAAETKADTVGELLQGATAEAETIGEPEQAAKAAVKSAQKVKKGHRFLKAVAYVLLFLLVFAIVTGGIVFFYARYTKTHYEVTFYQESSQKVSGNVRIAVISDLHNREYGDDNSTLLSDLKSLKPDLILFAGDMVIREVDDYQSMLRLVSALKQVAPCYGVLGNHESERIYSLGDRDLPDKFEQAGLILLRNAAETIQIGENRIQLIGVEGTSYGFEEYGGRKFMDEVEIDPSAYCIVMAHIPILFDTQLSQYDFDLGIAGHTHGGIVNLPALGGLYTQEEGWLPKYSSGRLTLSRQQSLIISRGLGDSASFPPRINNMPELVVIDINWI